MRQRFTVIALFASLALHGPAFARGEPLENIPLKWTPTSSLASMGALDLSGATLATKIRFDALVDARRNTSLIAENREEADKIRPVTTSGDVGAFVGDHLRESLHAAGLNIVEGRAEVSISGDSTRWGRSYSAANYYETMSDMVLRAAYNLLSNGAFREALGKR